MRELNSDQLFSAGPMIDPRLMEDKNKQENILVWPEVDMSACVKFVVAV